MAKRSWTERSKEKQRALRKRAAILLNQRHYMRNKPIRTALKTYINKAEDQIANTGENSREAVVVALSHLDKAASKGVIHPNQAARRKSRLMKKLNEMSATA